MPAPDFPTGGRIMGSAGARAMYLTGHGSVVVRAETHTEVIASQSVRGSGGTVVSRTKDAIVVTQLPYMTNKAGLLEKIADMVNDKKLEGISDLRDESDRDGVRLVIELKRDAVPALVQNNLFKKTALQTTFSGNMLALVDAGKQPRRVTLRSALSEFIAFRFATVRRRTAFQLQRLRTRQHIVAGLEVALSRMDEVHNRRPTALPAPSLCVHCLIRAYCRSSRCCATAPTRLRPSSRCSRRRTPSPPSRPTRSSRCASRG